MPRLEPRAAVLIFLLATLTATHDVVAQETQDPPRVRARVGEITIGGRAHTQFNTTSVDDQPPSEWLLRRVRLNADVRMDRYVSGRIMMDFAGNRATVTEAFVKYTFSPGAQLLAGRAHRPFSRLQQTSSTRMLPVERAAVIRGAPTPELVGVQAALGYSDRDVGIQFIGTPRQGPFGVGYAAALTQGPLSGGVAGSRFTYQSAARVTMQPSERWQFGAAWSSRDFILGTALPDGPAPRMRRGHAFEVDAEYGAFAPGPHLMAEFGWGDYNPWLNERYDGLQVLAGYRFTASGGGLTAVEPMARVSRGSISRTGGPVSARGGTLYTPGLNIYLGEMNRVMLNYDVWRGGDRDEQSVKVMFQLAF